MGSLAKSWVLEVGRVPYLLNCGRLSGKQVVGRVFLVVIVVEESLASFSRVMDLQRPFFLCSAGLWTWRGHEVRLGDLWHKKKEPWRVLTHCGVEGDILRAKLILSRLEKNIERVRGQIVEHRRGRGLPWLVCGHGGATKKLWGYRAIPLAVF